MLTKTRFSQNNVFLAIFFCITDVLRLLEKHVVIFIWKNREISESDLRLGFRHAGFYPSSTLYCPFCLLESHLHSFTAKVIYSWLFFTHTVIFTEHKRTCGCYCTEDHSSAENVQNMKSVQLETSTMSRLKTRIAHFSFQLALTPTGTMKSQWCTHLWPHH